MPIAKLTHVDADGHIEETVLERYSMGSLAEGYLADVEQHLLLCEGCRVRVIEAEAYISAMNRGGAELAAFERPPRWNFRLPMQAFAACAFLTIVTALSLAPSDRSYPPAAITLVAVRGTDVEAHGPSERVLLLQPNIDGLAVATPYRLETVDFSGSLIWHGVLSAKAQPPGAIVPPQSRGMYFVRVSLPSGELLREYALELL